MAKVTGIVYIRVDGKVVESEKGAKIIFGGFQRVLKKAGGRVIGYQEEYMEGGIECTVPHTANVDIDTMRDWVGATIKFETDTGVTWVITNAVTTDVLEMEDGNIALKMGGDAAEKDGA
jgi:hypothetical protein